MILAKSCHDMDILQWLVGSPCKQVQSFGSLSYFTPENCPDGSLYGIRGRGGVVCDLAWNDGKLSLFSLTAPYDGICRILPPDDSLVFRSRLGEIADVMCDGDMLVLACRAGEKYTYRRTEPTE